MDTPIIDAHLHVPKTDKDAISILLRDMDEASIERAVLIINTEAELQSVKKDMDVFRANKDRFHVVSGVNVNHENPQKIYSCFRDNGVVTDLKLHPKMYGYTMGDFSRVVDVLSALDFRAITIDSLCFGEQLENHIGVELAIKTAQVFPDRYVVIAHSGFIKLLECQMYTRNLQNIFYDLSFTASYINHTSVRQDMVNFLKHTNNRIMYGSDYPDFDFARAYHSFQDLCSEAGLSDEALQNVYAKNALKVYWNVK